MDDLKELFLRKKEELIDSSRTTITKTQGTLLNISTPRVRNLFYMDCVQALEERQRDKREKRKPKEVFLTTPTSANPYISKENIEENKRRLTTRLFDQYYKAIFVEDGQ